MSLHALSCSSKCFGFLLSVPPAQSSPVPLRFVSVPGGWAGQSAVSWSPAFCVRRNKKSKVTAEQWFWLRSSRGPKFCRRIAAAAFLTQVCCATHTYLTLTCLFLIAAQLVSHSQSTMTPYSCTLTCLWGSTQPVVDT